MPAPRRRPQSAGPARPKSKPSWDGTCSDLSAMKLSSDDLRMKLESRHHKPLTEYKGGVNIVTKVRPDGTEYKVGANVSLPAKSSISTPSSNASASAKEVLKARGKALEARGADKENAPCDGTEARPHSASLLAAPPSSFPPSLSGEASAHTSFDVYSGSSAIRAIADEALRALRIPTVTTTTVPVREGEARDGEAPA
eukprot:CAMPEP_0114131730 /NCGR_PEP_ID=MMETSP0043_2-20121206/12712_1 /TAXON_ID=464988 /ORGANISM="Hemiselmis andersenii, Strain CCMP644" /LENGTH=197 /DNA_ID=CAMNT_0001225187 /DNA_START=27 /DNA_END=617 /DNA_ORIENTATION=+